MLPRERVLATLDHQEPNRIPWGEHLIDYNIYEAFLGRKSFVNSHFIQQQAFWDGRRDEVVEHYKRDLPALADALGLDIITLPGPFPEKGEVIPRLERIGENEYRNENGDIFCVSGSCWLLPYKRNRDAYVPPSFESIQAEIEALGAEPPEDVSTSRWEVHRFIIEKMKPTHFVAALGGGIAFPKFGCDVEDQWISIIEQPELCAKLAELHYKKSIRVIETYAALGLDGIIPCADLGNSRNLDASPEIYMELVYPWQKKHAEKAHELGLKILLHCCGHTMPIVHHIAEIYDAYEAIQASAGMDIGVLKNLVGDKTTLWGGIRHENLNGGTPEDIRSDARYAISRAAPGGGFIIGSTHSLAVGAKIENVMEMKKCRDEWGNYPIAIE
jgi:uroporphyrinogen decarboxylase